MASLSSLDTPIAGSYSGGKQGKEGISRYGRESAAGGAAFDCRGPDSAELMSAPASPGRTWDIRIAERRLPVMVATAPASFFVSSRGVARLPDRHRKAAAEIPSHLGSLGNPGSEPGPQPYGNRSLDCALVPLPLDGRREKLARKDGR